MTLRIQNSVRRDQVIFTLTGRIQSEQVAELLPLVRSESWASGVVLDLEQVKLVDRGAVLFLALSEERGVTLINCPAYIREWINQERKAHPGEPEGQLESEE